ncbi:hypothetical protein EJ110_NYTH17547 [Nymphaea thermarum]|nr:hypothetical protein EJ110_NYTH17547 [Nymphaea thermarum]
MDAPVVDVGGPLVRETAASEWPFSCDLEVDFSSEKSVAMVYAALVVDKESLNPLLICFSIITGIQLQPDKVKRHMEVSDGKLLVRLEAVEARFLRASFSAFVDVLTLATKVIEQFGPKEGV